MSLTKLSPSLNAHVQNSKQQGTAKGHEKVICGFLNPENGYGPRIFLEGFPGRRFLRMNSNSYLGLSHHPRVLTAEAEAIEQYGTGPGAVRFISGTYRPHIQLEQSLAAFHNRQAAMIFSAAYAAVIGVLPALITEDTLVVSDELNHNCIINAIRLSNCGHKKVYPHLNLKTLEQLFIDNKGHAKRVCVDSDGVFSMRGDHVPLNELVACCNAHENDFEQGIITLIDDSHGVGAIGATGRGTEEITQTQADILIGTLGKAFGVNGGYVVSSQTVIDYLRETAASYIYSNPITPAEAAAASAAIEIVNSHEGVNLLQTVKALAIKLRNGLRQAGFETLHGEHPIVPVLIRDTERTAGLVKHCFDCDILVTGLNYPVVVKGEQEIRLQVCATHTEKDIEFLLDILGDFKF